MKFLLPTKVKVLISLIPFMLLFFMLPLLIPRRYLGVFMDSELGFFALTPSIAVHWLFTAMAIPLTNTFGTFGLMHESSGGGIMTFSFPTITIMGFFVIAFIYFVIIYSVYSLISMIIARR